MLIDPVSSNTVTWLKSWIFGDKKSCFSPSLPHAIWELWTRCCLRFSFSGGKMQVVVIPKLIV